MKTMYKDGEATVVHTYQLAEFEAKGWGYMPQPKAEEKPEKLTPTHEEAQKMGLDIRDDEGNLIHHKRLAKMIKEASDEHNEGSAS